MTGKWRGSRPARLVLAAALAALAAVWATTGLIAQAATSTAAATGNIAETAIPAGVIGLLFVTAGAIALWRRH